MQPDSLGHAAAVRLNWGCGPQPAAGWLNSDKTPGKGIQLCCNIRDGLPVDSHIRLYRQHPWASGFGISRVTVRDPRTPSGLETSWRAAAWVTGTDGMADIIAKRLPDVEVVGLRQNIGAAGHNIGIHRARTPYVALCDDDTWWSPGSVHHAVTLLQAHPRLAAVSARVLVGQEVAL